MCTKKVQLAACSHYICRACLLRQADKVDEGIEGSRSVPLCPICIKLQLSNNDNYMALFSALEGEELITKHGLSMSKTLWDKQLLERLRDLEKRYDLYCDYFIKMKTIFIHVPKTAGTSIENMLFSSENRSQHQTLAFWSARVGRDLWRDSFKFAICRHPYHRLVSGNISYACILTRYLIHIAHTHT